MKKNLILIVLFLVFIFVIASCDDKNVNTGETQQKQEVTYPVEIPFTEYSLEGTSCQWKKLSKDSCNYSQVATINSNEELERYIDCTEGTYPEIDFSKNTLLLANGVRCYKDLHNYTNFQQLSKQNYVLKVGFIESTAAALREWKVAIIVSKLEDGSSVTLEGGNVEFKNTDYPKEISFTEYSLEGTSCQWNYHSGAKQVIVINSKKELENYIECSEGSYPEIDFSKNTLLLVRSRATNGIHHIDIDFLQEAASEYTLNAIVYMLMTTDAPAWARGIIVSKMNNNAKITFNETHTNYYKGG